MAYILLTLIPQDAFNGVPQIGMDVSVPHGGVVEQLARLALLQNFLGTPNFDPGAGVVRSNHAQNMFRAKLFSQVHGSQAAHAGEGGQIGVIRAYPFVTETVRLSSNRSCNGELIATLNLLLEITAKNVIPRSSSRLVHAFGG